MPPAVPTGQMEYDYNFRYISREVRINSRKPIGVKRKAKEQQEVEGDNYCCSSCQYFAASVLSHENQPLSLFSPIGTTIVRQGKHFRKQCPSKHFPKPVLQNINSVGCQ